jgi:hypothetical protein
LNFAVNVGLCYLHYWLMVDKNEVKLAHITMVAHAWVCSWNFLFYIGFTWREKYKSEEHSTETQQINLMLPPNRDDRMQFRFWPVIKFVLIGAVMIAAVLVGGDF